MKKIVILLVIFLAVFAEHAFAELTMYKVASEDVYPDVYTVQSIERVKSISGLQQKLLERSATIKGYLVASDSAPLELKTYRSRSLPNVTFQKVNATLYKVHVDTDDDYILVFNQRFHPGWSIRIRDEMLSCQNEKTYQRFSVTECSPINTWPIMQLIALPWTQKSFTNSHFEINHLMNAWYISKGSPQDFYITFDIEAYMLSSVVISSAVILLLLGYISWYFVKSSSIIKKYL